MTDRRLMLVEGALHGGWVKTAANEIIHTERWAQITTPGSDAVLQNGVFRSVLNEAEVDEKIDETLAFYRTKNRQPWWVVTPCTEPPDMGRRLLAKGFKLLYTSIGMWGAAADIRLSPREGTSVEIVDDGNFSEWIAVQEEGWAAPPTSMKVALPRVKRMPKKQSDARVNLLVRVGSEPAGAGSIQFFDGWAHLFGGVVLPRLRGRGVFRTRVAASLDIIASRGISDVTAHCIPGTSAPIFRRFGFEEVCEIAYYVHD